MKNKTQEEFLSISNRSKHLANAHKSEQRIEYFRKAWQEGSLTVNTPRLAQRIIDFETNVEQALPKTPTGSE